MFADVHCHLDKLDAAAVAVAKASGVGVSLIVTNGLDSASNRVALQLAEQFPSVHAACGLYPNDSLSLSDEEVESELQFIKSSGAVAFGEVGLDYYHDDTQKDRMQKIFAAVLAAAESALMPVIVHSRKAEVDVLDMLDSSSVRVDLHCFGGSLKLVRRAVSKGYFFSIPTSVVRATHFQRIAQEVPLELLLSETDAPWMSPNDDPNEPANIPVVIEQVSLARSLPVDLVRDALFQNARRFFSLQK